MKQREEIANLRHSLQKACEQIADLKNHVEELSDKVEGARQGVLHLQASCVAAGAARVEREVERRLGQQGPGSTTVVEGTLRRSKRLQSCGEGATSMPPKRKKRTSRKRKASNQRRGGKRHKK